MAFNLPQTTYIPPTDPSPPSPSPPDGIGHSGSKHVPPPNPDENPFPELTEVAPPAKMKQAYGYFDAPNLCFAGGVAIFHLATARVVLCYHTRDKYWFLPKGRRDVNEESGRGAEREGFEESGYRNRLLPLPLPNVQPTSASQDSSKEPYASGLYTIEPVLTQFEPVSLGRQYMLHWYTAETLPPHVEAEVNVQVIARGGEGTRDYVRARQWEVGETLKGRIREDWIKGDDGKETVYEPARHEGTGVDEEEALYESRLMPVEEAVRRLKKTGMDWVVKKGWEGILKRWEMETKLEAKTETDQMGESDVSLP